MARTILEIAQEAARRDGTAPEPAQLFGTNNKVAKILRGAAKDTMRDYLRTPGWQGLSEFHSSWVFALRAGKYAYALPPDFLRIIPHTEQRNGWPLGLIGPVSPQSWAAWLYGGAATSAPAGWRIKNNVLWIEPTPTADELVVIEYISRYPVVSAVTVGDFDFSVYPPQTNAPVVPRDGHLNLPDASLLVTAAEGDAQYDTADVGYEDGQWPADPFEVLKRLNPMSQVDPIPQVRRAEFTADTDEPAFDDDYLLSIGMTFRLRRALGLPFAEQESDYRMEMEMKAANDAGGARSFTIGCDDGGYGTQTPLGGNRWLID